MDSATAFGWVLASMINDHVMKSSDEEGAPEGATAFCPECCGTCGAVAEFFATDRGRGVLDSFITSVGSKVSTYRWQNKDRTVKWSVLTKAMAAGWCLEHTKGNR